jgi:hypothetical protein
VRKYYVAVTCAGYPPVWEWRILTQSEPMGIIYEAGFTSEDAARRAGAKALNELLILVYKDEAE